MKMMSVDKRRAQLRGSQKMPTRQKLGCIMILECTILHVHNISQMWNPRPPGDKAPKAHGKDEGNLEQSRRQKEISYLEVHATAGILRHRTRERNPTEQMAEIRGISMEAWMRSWVRMAEAPAFWAAALSDPGVEVPAAASPVGRSLFTVSMMERRWATCQGDIHTCMERCSVQMGPSTG